MAGKRGKEVALQAEIESQEEWEEATSKEGLTGRPRSIIGLVKI